MYLMKLSIVSHVSMAILQETRIDQMQKNAMEYISSTSLVRSSTRTIESLVTPSRRGASLFLPDIFS